MIPALTVAAALMASSASAPEPGLRPADRICLAEGFRLAERVARSLWPGWERATFPVLLVREDREYLIRHPRPSDDFTSLGYDSLLSSTVFWRPRTYPTRIGAVLPVGGERTIVIGAPDLLGTKSTTSWVLNLLHEHFHQFQFSDPTYVVQADSARLAGRDTSRTWMASYPFPYDSAAVSAAFARMTRSLHVALLAVGTETFESGLQAYLRDRDAFAALVGPKDYGFLSLLFWQEGVPRYVEYRIAQAASEGYEPLDAFTRLDNFLPYARLAESHEHRIVAELPERDLAQERREVVYPVGAAVALLLDAAAPSWKARYFAEKFSLDRYFAP